MTVRAREEANKEICYLIEAYHEHCEQVRYTHGNAWRPMEVFLAIEGVLLAATINVWPNGKWYLIFFAGLGITIFAVTGGRVSSLEAKNNQENRYFLQKLLSSPHFSSMRKQLAIIPRDVEAFDASKDFKQFRAELSKHRLGVKWIVTRAFMTLAVVGFVISCAAIYHSTGLYRVVFAEIEILVIPCLLYLYTQPFAENKKGETARLGR